MFDKWQLFQERGSLCACGCGQVAHDKHHCCIPDLKRFHNLLDVRYNVALVNHHEHTTLKKFDNQQWRRKFYLQNVARYGQSAMDEWIASLPAKLAHRLDFLNH